MRSLLPALLVGMVVLLHGAVVRAQPPVLPDPLDRPATLPRTAEEEVDCLQKDVAALRVQLAAAQTTDEKDEDVKKRVELLQKQIETQQKMIELLVKHMQKQPLPGSPVEKLQTQVATLEGRSGRAAQRDQNVTQAVDNLTVHMDALGRNGPVLPATLKQLFLPSRTNETPLSIYGLLVAGYQLFPHEPGEGQFFFDEFEPIFLLQLNDHILLETKIEFNVDALEVHYAQMDYVVNDWLTGVAGRFLTPVGFFNERLQPDWINKMPDVPLMFRQVFPSESALDGIQVRGAEYLGNSPLKMEYSLYLTNGLGIPGQGTLTDLADAGALKDTTSDINDAMAFGGRLGLWVPERGFNGGFSLFFNRPYGEALGNDINLWDIDLNYHKGNWDMRFEYAYVRQDTAGFLDNNIHRKGLYAQVAYQPYDSDNRILRNLALIFRYSWASFRGIDPTALDLTAFETPVDAPVDRNQYTFGINYYFYPSLVCKFAYEINDEQGIDLNDNVFLTQLAWGF
jgi:hypothetical protein